MHWRERCRWLCSCQRECVERGGSGSKREALAQWTLVVGSHSLCGRLYTKPAVGLLHTNASIVSALNHDRCLAASHTAQKARRRSLTPAPHLLISRCPHTLADDAARRAASASVELSVVPAVRLCGPCPRRVGALGTESRVCRGPADPSALFHLPDPKLAITFGFRVNFRLPHGVAPSVGSIYKLGISTFRPHPQAPWP